MRSPGCIECTSACCFGSGLLISQIPSFRKRGLWSLVPPKLAPTNQTVRAARVPLSLLMPLPWICRPSVGADCGRSHARRPRVIGDLQRKRPLSGTADAAGTPGCSPVVCRGGRGGAGGFAGAGRGDHCRVKPRAVLGRQVVTDAVTAATDGRSAPLVQPDVGSADGLAAGPGCRALEEIAARRFSAASCTQRTILRGGVCA